MTRANPRIEIFYREKGMRRWFRSGRVYPLSRIDAAQVKMKELYKINDGKKEYLLKEYKR